MAPPTVQNAFALFALEELTQERVKWQFGGRLERNGFQPTGLVDRSFTAFSGSAGFAVPLRSGFTFATSFSHAARAPGLEELYNHGPHVGNLTYEVGNSDLGVERSNGVEASLRKLAEHFHLEANLFLYHFSDFIFLAPTGEREHGLAVANYMQGNARFWGFDGRLDAETARNLWLKVGFDSVNATLTDLRTGLPRIPPRRVRLGLDFRPGRFSFEPELALASRQDRTYFDETETAGYAVVNFRSSYAIATSHTTHIFSVDAFNLGNRLWRNHLSFIKWRRNRAALFRHATVLLTGVSAERQKGPVPRIHPASGRAITCRWALVGQPERPPLGCPAAAASCDFAGGLAARNGVRRVSCVARP